MASSSSSTPRLTQSTVLCPSSAGWPRIADLHGYAPQVRIGIHAGEVQLENGAVTGSAVHRAARLCAAAHGDTVVVSREALEASGRPLVGLREYTLKGIEGKVAAAEVAWEG